MLLVNFLTVDDQSLFYWLRITRTKLFNMQFLRIFLDQENCLFQIKKLKKYCCNWFLWGVHICCCCYLLFLFLFSNIILNFRSHQQQFFKIFKNWLINLFLVFKYLFWEWIYYLFVIRFIQNHYYHKELFYNYFFFFKIENNKLLFLSLCQKCLKNNRKSSISS